MMSLLQKATLPSAADAWQWWTGEILGCIPPTLRRRLVKPARLNVLTVADGDAIDLISETGDEIAFIGRFDLGIATGLEDLTSALDDRRQQGDTLVLRLPPMTALRSQISLPLAAQRNLAEAVAFELPRRIPFPPGDVLYAFRLVQRDAAAARLTIELTAVQKSVVARYLSPLQASGIDPHRIDVAAGHGFALPSPNLIPQRRKSAGQGRYGLIALCAIAIFLGATALLLPIGQAHQQVEALTQAIADEKRDADEALRLRQEIQTRTQEAGFLNGRKHDAVSPTRLLATLTHLLPDTTWLNELQLDGTDLQISGVTASSSSIIGLMDRSDVFQSPTFRSPVVQDQRSGNEQFNIMAKVRTGGTP